MADSGKKKARQRNGKTCKNESENEREWTRKWKTENGADLGRQFLAVAIYFTLSITEIKGDECATAKTGADK